MTLQELAEHARKFFESKTRQREGARGEETFWILKRRHPKWLKAMMFEIHDRGQVLSDDYKYEYAVEALDALSEGIDPDEPETEPDVYTHDLYSWLESHLERAGYVDEAVRDMGHSDQGVVGDIAQGQYAEKYEVWNRVVHALRERLDGIEEGVEEEFEGPRADPRAWSPKGG